MEHDQNDVRRLEADIATIKDAIRANNGFLRRMLSAPVLGWFFIGFGVSCAALTLAWEYALLRFGGAAGIPTSGIVVLVAVSLVVFLGIAIWKIAAFSRGAKAVDRRYSWYDVMRDLSTHPVLVYQPMVIAGTAFAAVMVLRAESGHLVPAAIAVGLAIVFMLYAVAFLLNEYSFIIVWLLLFAAAAVLLPAAPPLVMAAIGFGAGFVLFGVYGVTIGRGGSRA